MADQFTHTGNDPPSSKIETKIETIPLTVTVLPPELPVQPDLVPRFDELHFNYGGTLDSTDSTDGFVDLKFVDLKDQTPLFPCFPSVGKTFHDGPSLKVCDDASCEGDTTLKKITPVPASLDSFQKERASPECSNEIHTQEPNKLKPTFEEGKVVLGTPEALRDLVQCYSKLLKTTGVICEKDLTPDGDQYEKDAHYIEEKSLGQGSFGMVNQAKDLRSRKLFDIKKVSKDSFAKNEVLVPSMLNQVNIMRLYGLIHHLGPDREYMELFIEHAGLSLNKYRAKYPNIARTEDVVWDFCKQGLMALEHMDKFGIIHHDINPDTVCITEQNDGSLHLKISGFGYAMIFHQPLNIEGPTPEYFSPERCLLILQKEYKCNFGLSYDDLSGKSDIFAFGLVVIFMYMGYHILPAITNGQSSFDQFYPEQRDIFRKMLIVQVAIFKGNDHAKLLIPDICPLNIRKLLLIMLRPDFEKRGSASHLLTKHEHFTQSKRLPYETIDAAPPNKAEIPETVLQPVVDLESNIQSDVDRLPKTFVRNPSIHKPINDDVKRGLRRKLMNKANHTSIEDLPKVRSDQPTSTHDSQSSMEVNFVGLTRSCDSQMSMEWRSDQQTLSCNSQRSRNGRPDQPTNGRDSQMSIEWRPDQPNSSCDSQMYIEWRPDQPNPSCDSQSSMEVNQVRLTPSCDSQMSREERWDQQTRSSDCQRSMEVTPETVIRYPPMKQPSRDAVKKKLRQKLKKNADMSQNSMEDWPGCMNKKRRKQASPHQPTPSCDSQIPLERRSDHPTPGCDSQMYREGRPEKSTRSCASQRSIEVNPVWLTPSQDPETYKEGSPDRPIACADPPPFVEGVPNFEVISSGIDMLK
ncbi:hypothetical protein DPMN_027361 [Dreissena polymorpha]|uniref:non-specific serine/threonine protein kinase n=1 Tax=Dreissena polymorpha TaxID=45954 RepID=A0A9D4RDJ8_DREPO|nr:hypothetical protein DPMN_027361 [Dreissena polymorpha]